MGSIKAIVLFSLAIFAVPATLLLAAILVNSFRSDAREEFDAISRRFDRAQFGKDGATLKLLLATDMLFVRGSGKASGKSEFIAAFTDPRTDFDAFEIANRRIMPIGENAAIVSAEAIIHGHSGDERFKEHFRYSDTFARIGGAWQVVHVQVTPITKP